MAAGKKPYDYVKEVAADLRNDRLEDVATRLLKSHEGIFNGTELFMTWRHAVSQILKTDGISEATKTSALRAVDYFNEQLD
jgi:hypothetical protein